MKKLFLVALAIFLAAAVVWAEGYEKGKIYVGPSVGYGWGLGFGAQGEYGVADKIGVGGDISYTSFTEKYSGWGYTYQWKYTLIGFLVSGVYHFMPGKNFDPYVKAGLGFFNWDAEYSDSFGNSSSSLYTAGYSSGVGYGGQVGFRYFFSPTVAGRAAVGWPFYFAAGVDFKF